MRGRAAALQEQMAHDSTQNIIVSRVLFDLLSMSVLSLSSHINSFQVIRSFGHLVILSFCQLVNWSLGN